MASARATEMWAVTATDRSPDRLEFRGPEVRICYAAGTQGSRLQHATLLKRLGVGGTACNWRTVVAIEGLLSAG